MNVVSAPPSAAEWADSRVVLRDGTVATLRVTTPADHDALRRFFHELSPDSRRRRFFTLADAAETLIDAFCDSINPARQATVVVLRNGAAEAAFAVGDGFQGKGLGTIIAKISSRRTASEGRACSAG